MKLNDQKEKEQARENKKREAMEKLVQKGKRKTRGQTTLRGRLQGAMLNKPRTVERSGKEREGVG